MEASDILSLNQQDRESNLMQKLPRHHPHREFPQAKRLIIECDLEVCPICGSKLKPRLPWHTRKTIQTLQGPLFVAGKSKECANPSCRNYQQHYYASQVWLYSLPNSSYGLDVLAFIGWQHEHEHQQLVEIQRELNRRGIAINERNVGKLYRHFLALLGASSQAVYSKLEATVKQYGGLIWAIDALQPEGDGTLLYVLYEVLSGKPIAALQSVHVSEQELAEWLKPYQDLPFPVLATLSDGEASLVATLKSCWPQAPHQRCQAHFLSNLAEEVLDYDDQLRQNMRQDLGGLPAVPERPSDASAGNKPGSKDANSPF
jgi:hypothetical protein